MTKKICSICKKEYTGFGNNALPAFKGQCCDKCNSEIVIPIRMGIAVKKLSKKIYD